MTFSLPSLSSFSLQVPFSIPTHCNVCCLALFGLQLHWFIKMLKGAIKLIMGKKMAPTTTTITTTTTTNDQSDDRMLELVKSNNNNNNNTTDSDKNHPLQSNDFKFPYTRSFDESIHATFDTMSSTTSFSNPKECPLTFADPALIAGNFRQKTE